MVCRFRETVNRFGTRSSLRDWLALEKHPRGGNIRPHPVVEIRPKSYNKIAIGPSGQDMGRGPLPYALLIGDAYAAILPVG